MAIFNPSDGGLQPANMPDQTRASRGVMPSSAGAFIGKAAGDAASGVVDYMNTSTQDDIIKQVQTGYDAANKPFSDSLSGVLANPPAPGPQSDSPPPGMTAASQSIQSLQTAYEQGKISDVYYTGQLAAMTKNLRSQYPQYDQFVDQAVQSITGIKPANAYANAIQVEFAKTASANASQVDKQDTWLRDNSGYVALAAPGYFDNPGQYDPQKVIAAVADLKSKDQAITSANLQMDYADKQGKLTTQMATEAAGTQLQFISSSLIGSMGSSLGLGDGNILSKMGDMSGKSFTADQQNQIVSGLNTLGANMEFKLTQALNTPMNPNDPKSKTYYAVLGPVEAKAQIDQAMSEFNSIKSMAQDQNWGAFSYYTRMNKLTQDQDVNTMLGQSDTLRHVQAYGAISPALQQEYLQDNAKFTTIFAETAPELAARIATGQGTFQSYVDTMANSSKDAKTKADGLNTLVNTNLETVTSGKATPDQIHNAVQGTYNVDSTGKSIFSYVAAGDKQNLYNKLYSPAVTDSIVKSGNSQDMQTYYQSAVNASFNIPSLIDAAKTVQGAVSGANDLTKNGIVTFDPNTHQLVYDPGQLPATGSFINNNIQKSQILQTQQAIQSINSVFKTVQPILDAEKISPDDQAKAYQSIVQQYNINLASGKQDNFFDWVGKSFDNVMKGVSDAQSQVDPNKGLATQMQAQPSDQPAHEIQFVTPNDTSAAPVKSAILNSSASNGDPLKTAQAYLGKDERSAPDVQALEGFFKQSGIDIDPSKTPWCAAFVNSVLNQSGKKDMNGNLWAESFLNYGQPDSGPHVGDVVVFKGHVAFVSSVDEKAGTIDVLGGNQATASSKPGEGDAVTISTRPISDALSFRIPTQASSNG